MTVTLNLNQKTNEQIVLDPQSERWLTVIRNHTSRSRTCTVPKKYFDILLTWGLVNGSHSNAKVSPTGMSWLMTLEEQARQDKKSTKKKTYAPARSAGEVH